MKYKVRIDIDYSEHGLKDIMDEYIKKYGVKKVKGAIRDWFFASADGAFDAMDMLIEMEEKK